MTGGQGDDEGKAEGEERYQEFGSDRHRINTNLRRTRQSVDKRRQRSGMVE